MVLLNERRRKIPPLFILLGKNMIKREKKILLYTKKGKENDNFARTLKPIVSLVFVKYFNTSTKKSVRANISNFQFN